MASLLYDKRKKRWRVSFLKDGRRQRRFFEFKANARDFCAQMKFREERIENGLSHTDLMLFSDAIPLFESQYLLTLSRTTQATESNRIRQIGKHFTGKWIVDMDKLAIDEFVASRLRGGVSHKTALNDLALLSSFFKWATTRGLARENPVDTVNKPKPLPRIVRRALTREEVSRLLARSCSCCYPILVILVNCGLRAGELKGLERTDFDFDNHTLRLSHTESTPLKGKRGRVIPLNDMVEEVVRSLPPGKILGFSYWTLIDHFRATCKRAGFKACLHELRHTYLTELVSSGVDLLTARQISGHSKIRTLEKYLHWRGDNFEEIRNAVNFSVPYRCPQDESERKIRDFMAPYGHHDISKDQRVNNFQRLGNASPNCRMKYSSLNRCAGG